MDDLPLPAQRERLRKAREYTQDELAAALKTRRETTVRCEAGTTEPRPPKHEVYIRFLATLALQHGTVEPTKWLRRAQAAGLARLADQTATDPVQDPAPTETAAGARSRSLCRCARSLVTGVVDAPPWSTGAGDDGPGPGTGRCAGAGDGAGGVAWRSQRVG
ncbi:hypothetical protein [Kitasatospora sp. NPDC093102]|uniref:hypothetical protein n=1 Tax=Kitasatospora sp. NPDC093102 TaxID=3155069 RepID=UPI00342D8BDE